MYEMEKYDSYADYASTIPLRFTVKPPKLDKEKFEAYRELMDRARWLSRGRGGEQKVILEFRGRWNLFRSKAPLESDEVQRVLKFLEPRVKQISPDITIEVSGAKGTKAVQQGGESTTDQRDPR